MKLPTSLRFLCDDGDDECGTDGRYENLHWKNDEGTKVPTSLCMPPPFPLYLPCMPLPTALWWYSIYVVDSIVKCLAPWSSALGTPGDVSAVVAPS